MKRVIIFVTLILMFSIAFADEIDDILNQDPLQIVLEENGFELDVSTNEITISASSNTIDKEQTAIDAALELIQETYPNKTYTICIDSQCVSLNSEQVTKALNNQLSDNEISEIKNSTKPEIAYLAGETPKTTEEVVQECKDECVTPFVNLCRNYNICLDGEKE